LPPRVTPTLVKPLPGDHLRPQREIYFRDDSFRPFLPFILSLSSNLSRLSPRLEMAIAQIQLRDLGALLDRSPLSPQWGITTFCSQRHVLWALNKPKCVCGRHSLANAFLVYLKPIERAWWRQGRPVSVERTLKIKKNVAVVVSGCTLNVTM